MKNKLLGGAVLLMSAFSLNEVQATDCAVPPTCAQLGYTMKKADCGDMPVMRCPFALSDDNQVYCEGTVKVAALPILYGDGTVSKKLISGKTPIGVVFDEANRLAVALTNAKEDGSAGIEYVKLPLVDTKLTNCSKENLDTCGTDGRKNTDKLLACGDSCGGVAAARAVNEFQPAGCSAAFCKKGKWWLPSIKELRTLYGNRGAIRAVSLAGGSITLTFLWSSTDGDDWLGRGDSLWEFDQGEVGYSSKYQNFINRVLPVVKY